MQRDCPPSSEKSGGCGLEMMKVAALGASVGFDARLSQSASVMDEERNNG